MTVKVPDFDPRFYQVPFLQRMDDGCKRAVLVWHRRAGKEVTCWSWLIKQAFWHRVGGYVYYFPTSKLGRRILWDGADKNGRRFIDYIPKQLIDGVPNSVEMKIRLTNGSLIQIMGTENIINVGINPVGCVFSEFSLQNPAAWDYTRPILRENGGWAVFNFTPRGKNHAYELYQMAEDNEDWFCQRLTVADTGVLTPEEIEKEKKEGMSDHMVAQEFYCSFDQGMEGSIYAKLLDKADLDGRVTNVPYDPATLVDTYWDLGVSDATAIIFTQTCGNEIHIIDIYHCEGEGLNHYANILKQKQEQNQWIYGQHYAPHDIKVRELGSFNAYGSQTRWDVARQLGIKFEIVPNLPVIEGIEMARILWPRLWIDKEKCRFFLKCAENYHKKFNEALNVYSDTPIHDWSSHMMDAFRYMAVTYNKAKKDRMSEDEAERMQRMYSKRY